MHQESNFKYGLVAVDFDGNVVHYCGYEESPTIDDKEDLLQELFIDPELGLVGKIDYVILEASKDIVDYFLLNFTELSEE